MRPVSAPATTATRTRCSCPYISSRVVVSILAPLALLAGLSPAPEGLSAFKGLQQVEGRGEADQEAYEDNRRDKRIYRSAKHVNRKLREQHQRDKDEE